MPGPQTDARPTRHPYRKGSQDRAGEKPENAVGCTLKRKSRDFRVDRREDFFGKGSSTPLVVPGKSAESALVAIVSGSRKDMPRTDVHQLPAAQVAIVRAWIDAGAPWPERPAQQ